MLENDEDIGVDDELIEVEDKIRDLRGVKEPTEEQKEELKTLQVDRKSRLEKRTKGLIGRAKAAEEKARLADERVRQLEEKFAVAEKRLPVEKKSHQKVVFDGEEFYNDASLRSLVQSGEMTEDEAWDHQEQRRIVAAADRISKKNEKNTFESTRNKTIQEVLKEYPKLNPTHPKYDIEDPFTAEVDRLLRNGYQSRPDGLKNAVEDAKRNLRISDKRPDVSDDFSVASSSGTGGREQRVTKKVALEDWEEENAIRMWVNTGMTNPKTGRVYTKTEAIAKSLEAKTKRMEEMATR